MRTVSPGSTSTVSVAGVSTMPSLSGLAAAPRLAQALVLANELGKKSNLGIYDYRHNPPAPNPALRPVTEEPSELGA